MVGEPAAFVQDGVPLLHVGLGQVLAGRDLVGQALGQLRGQEGASQLMVKNYKRIYAEVMDNDGRGVQIHGNVTCGDGGVPGGTQDVDFQLSPGARHALIPHPVEGAGIWCEFDLKSQSPDFTLERIHLASEDRTLFGA